MVHPRSRSWSAIEAAFPVGASQLRVEDLEVCLHPSGQLWKLGNGSFGTVRLRPASPRNARSRRVSESLSPFRS